MGTNVTIRNGIGYSELGAASTSQQYAGTRPDPLNARTFASPCRRR